MAKTEKDKQTTAHMTQHRKQHRIHLSETTICNQVSETCHMDT